MNENKLLYRPSEAADAMGVSRAKAYDLIAKGTIPSIRLGGSLRIPVKALETWIANQVNDRGTPR